MHRTISQRQEINVSMDPSIQFAVIIHMPFTRISGTIHFRRIIGIFPYGADHLHNLVFFCCSSAFCRANINNCVNNFRFMCPKEEVKKKSRSLLFKKLFIHRNEYPSRLFGVCDFLLIFFVFCFFISIDARTKVTHNSSVVIAFHFSNRVEKNCKMKQYKIQMDLCYPP